VCCFVWQASCIPFWAKGELLMGCTRKIDVSHDPHLTDAIWDKIKHLIPEPDDQPNGGRPPHPPRACLAGILFLLNTGCQWESLPKCYPSMSTCWRRFDEWTCYGIFEGLWFSLLEELDGLGRRYLGWLHLACALITLKWL
jgi:transposase